MFGYRSMQDGGQISRMKMGIIRLIAGRRGQKGVKLLQTVFSR